MPDRPASAADARRCAARVALPAAVLLCTFIARSWGINRHFWMLGDQIRDWSYALGPFSQLPLVGPPTHVGGYTIGPAFYWVLWLIRITLGPWFDYLPHAGGIGQALLYLGADTLLLVAISKRTGSIWIALATVVLVATAPYDLALAADIWNPVMGAVFAKAATALVLLDWPRQSLARAGVTAVAAWIAVHCYTGAVFVASSIFAAMIAPPLVRGDRRDALRQGLIIASVVALLQVPYAVHRAWRDPAGGAMGTVVGSVERVVAGPEALRVGDSLAAYAGAVGYIQGSPGKPAIIGFFLIVCGALVAVRHRRDAALLAVTILPQLAAIAGFTLWIGDFNNYY